MKRYTERMPAAEKIMLKRKIRGLLKRIAGLPRGKRKKGTKD